VILNYQERFLFANEGEIDLSMNYDITTLDYNELKNKTKLPSFQRSVVWTKDKRKELIQTIHNGYPFGSLLLHETPSAEKRYSLVDGLQRLSAIMDYEKDKYSYVDIHEFSKSSFEEIYDLYEEKAEAKLNEITKNKIKDIISSAFKDKRPDESVTVVTKRLVLEMSLFDSFSLDVNMILDKVDKNITNYIDLERLRVPVVIFKGSESELPNIFESINSGGTKLSKYEIFASVWQGMVFQVDDQVILKWVDEKYDKMQEKHGLEISDYTTGSIIESKQINLFEYAYSIGKIIRNDYPEMFGGKKSEDASEIDSIGFGLLAAVLDVDLKEMGKIADSFSSKMDTARLINLKDRLVECSNEVNEMLKKFICAPGGKIYTKYIFAQIVSIVASLFKIRYSIAGSLNITTNEGSAQKVKTFKKCMPKHYLYDMIKGYWGNAGDSKVVELLKHNTNDNKYLRGISDEWWASTLDEWFAEHEKKESKSIDIVKKLFLNYMFNMSNPSITSAVYDIEHIIPQKRFEQYIGAGALSAVGNLCFLPEFENRSKKTQTLYEYFDETLKSGTIDEKTVMQRYNYPSRTELDFIKGEKFTKDNYTKFIKARHNYLAKKFIKSINAF